MNNLDMNDFVQVDANARPNPVLENVPGGQDKLQRVVDIAVPFLSLYRPASLATNTILGGVKVVQIVKNLPNQKNALDVCKQLVELAVTVSTVAFSFFMPIVGIGISQVYSVCIQVHRLGMAIHKHNFKEAAEAAANIALSTLYVASVITAAPEMAVISILAQAAFELYQASGEFRKGKGRFIEGMAKVVMAAFRLSQAAPMIKDLHRDYFGKQITQADLDRYMKARMQQRQQAQGQDENITSDVNHRGADENTTFEDFANLNHYSRRVNNLSFDSESIANESFKKFRFFNCSFEEMTFEKCKFTDVKFTNCNFNETFFWNCTMKDTSFVNSVFDYHCMFFGSSLSHVTYDNCDLKELNFTDANLYKTNFENSTMHETCFLDATVKACKIRDCDLTDTLFCGTEARFDIKGGIPNTITKPVVGILWDHTNPQAFASIGHGALVHSKAIPLKIDYRLREIKTGKLENQVDSSIAKIRQMNREDYLSVGDELLNRASPKSEIAKIHQKAAKAVAYCDGIYLPGGVDIAEQFYQPESISSDKEDYARSVLESAVLKEAFAADLPILTACRGTQMLNVYRGGTLHQSVENHSGVWHKFQIDTTVPQHIQDINMSLIGDTDFIGLSAHHQGCDEIGSGLYVTMRAEDGLPECLISENGKAVGTQFHPEFAYIFPPEDVQQLGSFANSYNFFTRFVGLAEEHRQAAMDVA